MRALQKMGRCKKINTKYRNLDEASTSVNSTLVYGASVQDDIDITSRQHLAPGGGIILQQEEAQEQELLRITSQLEHKEHGQGTMTGRISRLVISSERRPRDKKVDWRGRCQRLRGREAPLP